MRRRLNFAYLVQYFLMLVIVALLLLLAARGAPGYIFVLVFLAGILAAALPGFYSGYVLSRRELRRAESVRRTGLPARAQVMQDGVTILAEFRRTTMGYKGVRLLLDVPVLLHPSEEQNAHKVSMKAEIDSMERLKSGMLVGVRCDPEDPQYVVLDGPPPDRS